MDDLLMTIYLVVKGISIPKLRWFLYHFNINVKTVKHQLALNGRTDILITIIDLLRFLNRTNYYRNHHAKFKIYRTILSSTN